MASFPPATNTCKELQTIVLFFQSDHFIDTTTPPPYFLFVVGCYQENMSRGTPLNQSESAKFPLLFKYTGAQST